MMPVRQAEAVVDAAHPLGVALGQVVVLGDEVRALACECVQVQRAEWRPASCLRRCAFRRSCPGATARRRQAARRNGACCSRAGWPRAPRQTLRTSACRAIRHCRIAPLNSSVLARSSASLSFIISGSSALQRSTIGLRRASALSLSVPTSFVNRFLNMAMQITARIESKPADLRLTL